MSLCIETPNYRTSNSKHTPGPALTPTTTGWQSALKALETKNVEFEIVLGKLLIANDQAQGHLQHAFTRQQQMGQAILDLKKDSAEMKKAIETLKKQQVALVSTPSKSKISSLQSLSGGILGAQNSVPSDTSPFANY
ncbi:hypothetical protein KCU99_g2714, partial [Aureobasidium melanogenum]